jgi:hypothetical protein
MCEVWALTYRHANDMMKEHFMYWHKEDKYQATTTFET